MVLNAFRETRVMTKIPIIKYTTSTRRIDHKVAKTRVSVFKTKFPQLEVT